MLSLAFEILSMKNILVITALSVMAWGCNSANKERPSAKYEEKKASMADMEQESPLKFLKVSGNHRKNLVNQTVVEGEVSNRATLTDYKDIEVSLTFIDKEGGTVEKQKHTLDEEVKAGSTIDFKIKVSGVKGAASVTIDIVDATPVK